MAHAAARGNAGTGGPAAPSRIGSPCDSPIAFPAALPARSGGATLTARSGGTTLTGCRAFPTVHRGRAAALTGGALGPTRCAALPTPQLVALARG
jgi:hypothetical protein